MATWYYVENNQQAGPLTDEQLAQLVTQGRIQANTLVWNETMANWQPYGQVRAAAVQRQAEALATGTPAGTGTDTPTPLRAAAAPAMAAAAAAAAAPGAITCSQCGLPFPQDEVVPINGQWVCAGCKPLVLQQLREGVGGPAAMNYAGFWIRFAAKVIDGLILFVVNLVVGLGIQGVFAAAGAASGHGTAIGIAGLVVTWGVQLFLGLGYTVFFLGRFGATPGKMACGLIVVRSDGSPLTYGRAVGRHFADILSGLTLCIGYLMVAFDQEKRALHDYICDTRVISK